MTSATPTDDTQERRRLARLRLLAVMDSDPEPIFEGLVRIASLICGTPISLVSLVDDHRQWFKANHGLDGVTETPRDIAFCAHAIHDDTVMEVPDAHLDSRFAQSPLVLGDPHIRFYAGAPIRMPGGERIGTLCVIDRKPRVLNDEQRRALQDLAAVAQAALLQREQHHVLEVLADDSRLRAISDAAPLAIFQANEQGHVFYANAHWHNLFNKDGEPCMGLDWQASIHPLERETVARAWHAATLQGRPFDMEVRLLRGADVLYARLRANPATWGDPPHKGYVGMAADITDRRRAQQSLDAANRFLQRAEQIGGVGGWDADLRSRTVRWTEQNSRIYELPPGHQPSFDEHLKYFDSPTRARIESAAAAAIQSGQPWDLEMPMTTAKGRAIWVRSVGQAEFGDEGDVRLVGTLQDISAQKAAQDDLQASEERQRRALEASRLALWDYDLESGHLYLSENWSELLGGPSQPTVTSFEALTQIVPQEDHAHVQGSLAATFKGEIDGYEAEHRVRRLDGSIIWIHSKGRVTQWAPDGRALHATGTNQDITARKAAEAEIKASHAAAEAASKAKSDFLATISHEIRTPLNGVVGITELLLSEELSPRQRSYAQLIDSSAHSLLTLINDLLDLGKIEAGRVALEDIAFNVDELLAEVAQLYTLRASEKSLLFKKTRETAVPLWLSGDPHRVRQILSNLLTNALKFTQHGEVGLTVSASGTDTQRPTLRFRVHDTGIGMSEEVQSRLFNRFMQADSSTTRQYGGSGLGLAIVKQLCEMMGGSVTASSKPGQGSVFTCEIPFKLAAAKVASGPKPAGQKSRPDRNERILIVEDNSTNQIVIRGLLAQLGFKQVALAVNGQEAIDAVAADKYDAVMMDCHMPVMDGFEATHALRTAGARMPIIAMTASATAADRERCLAAGMDDYLSKPLDSAKLEQILAQWLVPPAEPRLPVFERDAALARLGGSEELLTMITSAFVSQTPKVMDELRSWSQPERAQDVRRHLHSLAGASASAGAACFSGQARLMEELAAAGDSVGALQALPVLARQFEDFCAALDPPTQPAPS